MVSVWPSKYADVLSLRETRGDCDYRDVMLPIRSEMDAWNDKKGSRQASIKYNEMLYYGLEDEDVEI